MGPTSVHGLRARDVVDAPVFAEIMRELTELLAGRVVVAHNLPFDVRFLRHEYGLAGYPDIPLADEIGLCTMQLAARYLPIASRGLAACCRAAGLRHDGAHAALADAHAAAGLLRYYLSQVDGSEAWLWLVDEAASWPWPVIPEVAGARGAMPREEVAAERLSMAALGADGTHFLARLAPFLPRVPEPPQADAYLAVLDDALADRKVDPAEASALIELAADLGIDRPTAEELHRGYLRSVARATWEDGVVEAGERADLEEVALLLGLPVTAVDQALKSAKGFTGGVTPPVGSIGSIGSIRVTPGERVCFTGEMNLPRSDLEALATAAGLVVTGAVSKKTALLVCADADSQSAKARKARQAGTTVVSEPKFLHLLAALRHEAKAVEKR